MSHIPKLQGIGVIARFNIHLPPEIDAWLLRIPDDWLQVNVNVYALECMFEPAFFGNQLGKWFGVLALMISYAFVLWLTNALLYLVLEVYGRQWSGNLRPGLYAESRYSKQFFVQRVLFCLFVLFPTLTSSVLDFFDCVAHPSGPSAGVTHRVFRDVRCGEGVHAELLGLAAVMAFVVIGLPLIAFLVTFRQLRAQVTRARELCSVTDRARASRGTSTVSSAYSEAERSLLNASSASGSTAHAGEYQQQDDARRVAARAARAACNRVARWEEGLDFMTGSYRPAYYYWVLPTLLKDTLLCLGSLLFASGFAQCSYAACVALGYAAVVGRARPMFNSWANLMEILLSVILAAVALAVALAAAVAESAAHGGGGGAGAASASSSPSSEQGAVSLLATQYWQVHFFLLLWEVVAVVVPVWMCVPGIVEVAPSLPDEVREPFEACGILRPLGPLSRRQKMERVIHVYVRLLGASSSSRGSLGLSTEGAVEEPGNRQPGCCGRPSDVDRAARFSAALGRLADASVEGLYEALREVVLAGSGVRRFAPRLEDADLLGPPGGADMDREETGALLASCGPYRFGSAHLACAFSRSSEFSGASAAAPFSEPEVGRIHTPLFRSSGVAKTPLAEGEREEETEPEGAVGRGAEEVGEPRGKSGGVEAERQASSSSQDGERSQLTRRSCASSPREASVDQERGPRDPCNLTSSLPPGRKSSSGALQEEELEGGITVSSVKSASATQQVRGEEPAKAAASSDRCIGSVGTLRCAEGRAETRSGGAPSESPCSGSPGALRVSLGTALDTGTSQSRREDQHGIVDRRGRFLAQQSSGVEHFPDESCPEVWVARPESSASAASNSAGAGKSCQRNGCGEVLPSIPGGTRRGASGRSRQESTQPLQDGAEAEAGTSSAKARSRKRASARRTFSRRSRSGSRASPGAVPPAVVREVGRESIVLLGDAALRSYCAQIQHSADSPLADVRGVASVADTGVSTSNPLVEGSEEVAGLLTSGSVATLESESRCKASGRRLQPAKSEQPRADSGQPRLVSAASEPSRRQTAAAHSRDEPSDSNPTGAHRQKVKEVSDDKVPWPVLAHDGSA